MDLAFENTFDIRNYGGKAYDGKTLFSSAPIKLGTTWTIPGVLPTTPEGKEVEKMVRAVWVKEMEIFAKAKEKEYKDILLATERALFATAEKMAAKLAQNGDYEGAKAAIAKWLGEEAKGANVMIGNALKTFEGVAQKKMSELWDKIATVVDKKFKGAIRQAKILAVVKITGLAILIVVAAALTIAAAVLAVAGAPTGVGALAGIGLALGGIATIASAAAKISGVYATNWPNHKTAAATLAKKAEALKLAIEYEEKKVLKTSQGAKLGPKEKAKIFFANTKGKRAELDAAVKSIATWTASMLQDVEKSGKAELLLEQKLAELEKQLVAEKDKKKAAELKKACDGAVKTIFDARVARENTRLYLRRYLALTDEATVLLATEDKLTSDALGNFLSKIMALAKSKEMETLIAVGKTSGEFMKALIKFQA